MKRDTIKIVAEKDAEWDNCFVDLRSMGIKTNRGLKIVLFDPKSLLECEVNEENKPA